MWANRYASCLAMAPGSTCPGGWGICAWAEAAQRRAPMAVSASRARSDRFAMIRPLQALLGASSVVALAASHYPTRLAPGSRGPGCLWVRQGAGTLESSMVFPRTESRKMTELKIERADVWAASVQDEPGGLATILAGLEEAGADLEFILARRAPDKPRTGVG